MSKHSPVSQRPYSLSQKKKTITDLKSENTTLSNKLEKLQSEFTSHATVCETTRKNTKASWRNSMASTSRSTIILSFSKQCDTSLQRAVYNFHTTIIIKTIIGSSISMKLAYQTQIKQYNDQSHLVCGEHGFVVNKINTSIKKTVHKKIDLKVQCDMQALFM